MIKLIIGFIAVILAGGVFFLYTQPTYDTVQATQAQIDEQNQALDKSAQLQKLEGSLSSAYNSFDPSMEARLEKLLPDHVDNIALILDLDSIASRYGLGLQNVDISTPSSQTTNQTALGAVSTANQSYDSLTLTFSTRGTYASFLQFLTDLETSLRIVDLSSLSITRVTASGSSAPTYDYDIALRTYWLK